MTSWCEFFFLSLFFFFVSAKGWLLLRFASVELSRCQFWKAALEIWSLRLYISEQMPHPELPRPWHHWALARCLQDARLLWRQDFRGSPASRVGVFFFVEGGISVVTDWLSRRKYWSWLFSPTLARATKNKARANRKPTQSTEFKETSKKYISDTV